MAAPQISATHAPSWFLRFLSWREKHIKENTFLVILALFVGLFAGFAAMLLKWLIHTIGSLLIHYGGDPSLGINFAYIFAPAIGIVLVVLYVKYVVKDNISHGVTQVLWAISQNKSRLKQHNMYTSLVASSVTIGFGGSVGAEGPIVYTGAAIGSNLGSLFRLSPRILMILVGCGAAAGIAGIFKAPIAGMLFTIEVLMLDMTSVTIMPLLIASITGATIAYIYTGYNNFEFFYVQSHDFRIASVPYAVLLGVVCGFVSLYFTNVMNMMEGFFSRFKDRPWIRTLVGCLVLTSLIFLFPPLYGEGYDSINSLLRGDASAIMQYSPFAGDSNGVIYIILFIAAIILLKAFATSSTNGAGGVGGTFAPSLYVGCLTGFLFAFIANQFGVPIDSKNFALIGMAGVMSGVMHAPLMAIFLTAELTGGYSLFLPLLIVSAISYFTIKFFKPYSIYATRLARKGELITHHKDKTVLTLLKVNNVIERDFKSVTPHMTLKEMVDVISQSSRNLFPVLDDDGKLLGIVLLDEIRNIMFRPDLYRKMTVSTFMSIPPAKIDVADSMEKVMKTFDKTGAWNLPVVEGDKYVGFVSKSKIFNSYRRVLRHYCED